jgi:L-fuconolactonase
MNIIDTHHHFWHYSPDEYSWIAEDQPELRRDYLPEDLGPLLGPAGVAGVISVQARQSTAETTWLLQLADRHRFIRAVVGWVPLTDPTVGDLLDLFSRHPAFRGVRHVLQTEADPHYMLRPDFNRGLAMLKEIGLRYDLLIYPHQLPQSIDLVDRHPQQAFILDHLARPTLRAEDLPAWRSNLGELARRDNVYCKLSGGLVESTPRHWTAQQLAPYWETALEAFGADRLMFGSNWPLTEVAGGYGRWLATVRDWAGKLSPDEQGHLFSGTALEAYGLEPA